MHIFCPHQTNFQVVGCARHGSSSYGNSKETLCELVWSLLEFATSRLPICIVMVRLMALQSCCAWADVLAVLLNLIEQTHCTHRLAVAMVFSLNELEETHCTGTVQIGKQRLCDYHATHFGTWFQICDLSAREVSFPGSPRPVTGSGSWALA